MAGTVPRALSGVPANLAAKVGTRRGSHGHVATLIAVHRGTVPGQVENLSLTAFHGAQRTPFGAGKSIANQVVRVVLVFADVVPRGAADFLAADVEEVSPRIRPAQDAVGRDHRAKRPEGHAVAGEPRCRV